MASKRFGCIASVCLVGLSLLTIAVVRQHIVTQRNQLAEQQSFRESLEQDADRVYRLIQAKEFAQAQNLLGSLIEKSQEVDKADPRIEALIVRRTESLKTEKEAFATSQRSKGLVEFEGKWVTPAEKTRIEKERFAVAQRAKGLVEFEGQWIAFAEAQKKRGLVELDGKWISPDEKRQVEYDREREALENRRLAGEVEMAELLDEYKKRTVQIATYFARKTPLKHGSGFVVDKRGIIATNHHVIRGATSLKIQFIDGTTVDGKGYAGVWPGNDLALIRIDPPVPAPWAMPLASTHPTPGVSVWALGHPKGLAFSVSRGVVSAVRKHDDFPATLRPAIESDPQTRWIQTDTPISSGSSGGPLLNEKGEVVGVSTVTFGAQNLNVAASSADLIRLLSKAGETLLPVKTFGVKPVAIYRMSRNDGYHFYPIANDERAAFQKRGYGTDGILGYGMSMQLPGSKKIRRFRLKPHRADAPGMWVYITSREHLSYAIQRGAKIDKVESYPVWAWPTSQQGTTEVNCLINPTTGEFFYTSHRPEYDGCVKGGGIKSGISFFLYPTPDF